MGNSILQAYTVSENPAVTTLLMRFHHPNMAGKAIIAVEGVYDNKFYSKFTDSAVAEIHYLGGCRKLEDVLKTFANKFPQYTKRLAGIKDADFCHMTGIHPAVSNLFFTDFHDFEMSLVSVDKIKRLVGKFKFEEDEASAIFDKTVSELKYLSYIKLHNWHRAKGNRLSFKSVSLNNIWNKDLNQVIEYTNNLQNDTTKVINKTDIDNLMANIPTPDYRQLHNGHDFLSGMALEINGIKPQNANEAKLRKELSDIYTDDEFKMTALYNSISSYFNPVKIFN